MRSFAWLQESQRFRHRTSSEKGTFRSREELMHFDTPMNSEHLEAMLRANWLKASLDGRSVASVHLSRNRERCIHHAHMGELPTRFVESEELHILSLTDNLVMVWGQPTGRAKGIWILSANQADLVYEMETFDGFLPNTSESFATGRVRADEPDLGILTRNHLLMVDSGAKLEVFNDNRVSVTELIQGTWFHYLHSNEGAETLQRLRLHSGEQLVRVLHWGSRLILALYTRKNSYLRAIGTDGREETTEIEGVIEEAWSSPSMATIALLTRVGKKRRLTLGGELVHEGIFQVDRREDLSWSNDGHAMVITIKEVQDGQLVTRLISASTNSDRARKLTLRPNERVQEMAVDEKGVVRGLVYSDGRFQRPSFNGLPGSPSTLVWNMRLDQSGSLTYNTVAGNTVLWWETHTTQLNPQNISTGNAQH